MATEKTTNAKKDDAEAAKKAAAAQTQQPKSEIGSAASRKAAADDETDTGEDAPTGNSGGDDFLFRGILMSVLIRLPAALAYSSQGKTLDEMMAFVNEFDTRDERYVVVEMIKAIAEVQITDIPGGAYKNRVRSAMDVVNGTAVQVSDIRDPHSQQAAADRLNYSISGMQLPEELERKRHEMEAVNNGASAEQLAAAERLYGQASPQ